MTAAPPPSDADLDRMQWVADPHADRAVEKIVGEWPAAPAGPPGATAAALTAQAEVAAAIERIKAVNEAIRAWDTNRSVREWKPTATLQALKLDAAVAEYLRAAGPLPDWAEPARLKRAEKIFMDQGAMSVLILFCSSLPECYVVPDLAAVLHATGQLEDRAEHRIRATGSMIFPAMMRGGLTEENGGGIAQILKVRLIHAMVRNLILRGSPEAVIRAELKVIPELAKAAPGDGMFAALYVHGWDLGGCGLPNNQEELAYTLLTFNYVFLRSMRTLGLGLGEEEERDYMHLWNVAGHYLGIERTLMAETFDEAAALFTRMQARGRRDLVKHPLPVDPRPRLGRALMGAMQSVIPPGPFKAFPVLFTRHLVEAESARDLGLEAHVSPAARVLFAAAMGITRGIDAVGRLFRKDFSLSRLFARILGYHLICKLMMDQTRELMVPDALKPGLRAAVEGWSEDPDAPGWMNAIEDRCTTPGPWRPAARSR